MPDEASSMSNFNHVFSYLFSFDYLSGPILIILAAAAYKLSKPVIAWAVSVQAVKLLSYAFSSLAVLLLFALGVKSYGGHLISYRQVLQYLAVFGLVLYFVHVAGHLFRNRKRITRYHK